MTAADGAALGAQGDSVVLTMDPQYPAYGHILSD